MKPNAAFSSTFGLYILPQPNQQHKTKQNNLDGVVLLSVKKTHHTTPQRVPGTINIKNNNIFENWKMIAFF